MEAGLDLTENRKADLESWPSLLSSKIVNLGLDLRGGAHLLVEVSLADVYTEKLDALWLEFRKALREIREEVGSIKRIPSSSGSLKIELENLTRLI